MYQRLESSFNFEKHSFLYTSAGSHGGQGKGCRCSSKKLMEIECLLSGTVQQARSLLALQLQPSGLLVEGRPFIIKNDSTLHVLVSDPTPPLASHFHMNLFKTFGFLSPGGKFEPSLFLSLCFWSLLDVKVLV